MEEIKRSRGALKIIIIVLIVAISLSAVFGLYNYYKSGFTAMAQDDENLEEVLIEIPSGSSTNKIGRILRENGLIRNEIIFEIAIRQNEVDGQLKAGKYTLNTGMDLDSIIEEIFKGSKNEDVVVFTIPEGYELVEIAEKLSKENLVNEEKFLKLAEDKKNFEKEYPILKNLEDGQSLEGFLFPSTYEVYIGASERDIIKRLLDEFQKTYEKHIKDEMYDTGLTLNEIVTLASMVEREARVEKERPMMAGVLYNRLEIDMLLQIDATVQYALDERKERLLYKDLEIDSPYNTYLYKGLPPGPIASPGEKSIIATMNPTDTDYLFYVLKKDGSGEHIFTKTYKEHIDAQE